MADTFRTLMADADEAILDALGETATIDGTSVVGVFSREYVESLGVAGYRPIFTCRTVDAPTSATRGSIVVYDGSSYRVADIQPEDVELMVTYILEG